MRNYPRAFTLIELLVVVAILAILAALIFPVLSSARERARVAVCQSNLKQLGAAFHLYLDDWDGYYPMPLGDKGGIFKQDPSLPTWKKRIFSYVRSAGVYDCPSNGFTERVQQVPGYEGSLSYIYLHEVGASFSYSMNQTEFNPDAGEEGSPDPYIVAQGDISDTADVILLTENQSSDSWQEFRDLLDCGENSNTSDYFKQLAPPYGCFVFTHTSDGRANWLFCDGHVRSLRIRDTLTPRLLWIDPRYQGEPRTGPKPVNSYPVDLQNDADRIVAGFPPAWR